MKDLDTLKLHNNSQVVINHYENDELIDKNGFFFDFIDITASEVHFLKENNVIHRIRLDIFSHFHTLKDFKNYYSLTNETTTLEIYFP